MADGKAKQRKEAGQPGGPSFQPNAAGIDIGAREPAPPFLILREKTVMIKALDQS